MFTVIYQWRIRPELEAEFLRVWHVRTQKIEEHCGSFGARLHKGDDGTYFSVALWPSREKWETFSQLPDDAEDERIFRASIQEFLGTKTMVVVDDLWSA
ncbi:MAG: antibiotic biosynthesis monooxygenase [Candidatus Eremiobacteraeota bacterium]|nr:antibiotic biosynthesis monooxygenase [Candidatus Eremiobacteraeota bacterium]